MRLLGRWSAIIILVWGGAVLCACGRAPHQDPGAAQQTAVEPDRLSVLRAGDETGFALAQAARRFEFPQDHGPHAAFRHEWWYFTGQLRTAAGKYFGFELTVFRLALRPEATAAHAAGSAWRARQLYAAHFAVSDLEHAHFFSATRYARDALGLTEARAQPFAIRVADWSVTQAPGSQALQWHLVAVDGDYQLQLTLASDQAPVLNGAAGLSRKSDTGAASYYYSMPHLQASGVLTRAGSPMAVSGEVWLDREWGSGSLGPQQQGWDWFALDLDDGSAVMFYALRDQDGRRDAYSAGTYVDGAGHVTALASTDVGIQVQRQWSSPRGGQYPAQWQLRIASLGLDLQVTPLLADQELATQPRYWEGAVQARGTRRGTAVGGRGYVELVGYAHAQATASMQTAKVPPTH